MLLSRGSRLLTACSLTPPGQRPNPPKGLRSRLGSATTNPRLQFFPRLPASRRPRSAAPDLLPGRYSGDGGHYLSTLECSIRHRQLPSAQHGSQTVEKQNRLVWFIVLHPTMTATLLRAGARVTALSTSRAQALAYILQIFQEGELVSCGVSPTWQPNPPHRVLLFGVNIPLVGMLF